jgi:hypothetical protein
MLAEQALDFIGGREIGTAAAYHNIRLLVVEGGFDSIQGGAVA